MAKLLEIKNLVTNFYTYEGKVNALNRVHLDLDEGITFGLVGESGCGKSVTVRSIMRIIQPPGQIEEGEVLFYYDENGKRNCIDLLQQSEEYMQDFRGRQISMIFQEPNSALNPVLTIGDQISESFLFHQQKEICKEILEELKTSHDWALLLVKPLLLLAYQSAAKNPKSLLIQLLNKIPFLKHWDKKLKREAERRSIQILEKLLIPNPQQIMKAYPHNLSGGMKQRIVIAIALACHPVLLIADEATSNLDVTIQAQILELLSDLKKEVISSILLITHDLGVVAETCDRAGVMYAGNICEVADVNDLFKNPKHPYTKALLKSVPRFSQEGMLETIEGSVPNLAAPPSGCRFHPRCPEIMDVCKQIPPPLIGQDHQIACHLFTSNGKITRD